MDHTFVNAIAALARDADTPLELKVGLDKARHLVLHGNQKVESLEHLAEGRYRFRGKLVTQSLSDFLLYTKNRAAPEPQAKDEKPRVFVDGAAFLATAFFNLGGIDKPGHGDDIAVLTLKKTAPYTAALAVNGKAMSQADAVFFVEDWNAFLSGEDEGHNPQSALQVLAALRKVKVTENRTGTSTVSAHAASREGIESIAAHSDFGLPAFLLFRCPTYLGLMERDFRFRVSVVSVNDKPAVVLRMVSKESVEEDIAQEFKSVLLADLAEKADVVIGTFTP